MTSRSNFPNSVDTLPELSNILASDATNIARYNQLLMQATRTSAEETELNNLKTTLGTKLLDAEYLNFLADAITAVQNYFLNQVMSDIAKTDVGVLQADMGDITQLSTVSRDSIVNAVNECNSKINYNYISTEFDLTTHTTNTSNPHKVTASQVGAYSKSEVDTTFVKKLFPTYIQSTLLNGFASTGLSTGNPSYWKSDAGIVYIKGACTIPSNPSNKDIFVLPVGYRPSTTMTFTLNNGILVTVYSSGSVQFTSDTTGNLQFGCISFPAEQ